MGTIQPILFTIVYIKNRSPWHPVDGEMVDQLQQGGHTHPVIRGPWGC